MTLQYIFWSSTMTLRVSFVLMCALLFSTACLRTDKVLGTLDADLTRARSEVVWVEQEAATWRELQAQAELSWLKRAQYKELSRVVVSYERAHELGQQDPTLDDAQRVGLSRRQQLRLAHAYFLLGYMKLPLEGQRSPDDLADSRVAFERGARFARGALGLDMTEPVMRRLLSTPTPGLLEQVSERDALDALYWYALNTHFTSTYFKAGIFGQDKDVTLALLDHVAVHDSSLGHGSVLGLIGTHHARYGRGGGDASKSRRFFEKGVDLGPNNLMLHVMYAEHYAVMTQNALLFDRQLELVLNAPAGLLGGHDQENLLAVRRARMLQSQRDELFY